MAILCVSRDDHIQNYLIFTDSKTFTQWCRGSEAFPPISTKPHVHPHIHMPSESHLESNTKMTLPGRLGGLSAPSCQKMLPYPWQQLVLHEKVLCPLYLGFGGGGGLDGSNNFRGKLTPPQKTYKRTQSFLQTRELEPVDARCTCGNVKNRVVTRDLVKSLPSRILLTCLIGKCWANLLHHSQRKVRLCINTTYTAVFIFNLNHWWTNSCTSLIY